MCGNAGWGGAGSRPAGGLACCTRAARLILGTGRLRCRVAVLLPRPGAGGHNGCMPAAGGTPRGCAALSKGRAALLRLLPSWACLLSARRLLCCAVLCAQGLWLLANAAGPAFAPHVRPSLQLALELVVSWWCSGLVVLGAGGTRSWRS